MPKWIRSIYLWTTGKGIPAANLIVWEDYSSGKKKYKILPENVHMFLKHPHYNVGFVQDFIIRKEKIQKKIWKNGLKKHTF